MNAVLQRHGARYIFGIPEGLKELMMDISREVLRSQPVKIYSLIADYCDALMITRENARIATQVVDNITDCSVTIAELLQRTGIERHEADQFATVIQKHFRQFLDRKYYPQQEDIGGEEHMIQTILRELDLPRYLAEKAQKVIKSAWQSYKERQKLFENDVEFVNWRKALCNAMFLYRRTGIPEEAARRAASTIQAAYHGYYTRRYLKILKKKHEEAEDNAEHRVNIAQPKVTSEFPPEVQEAFLKLRIDPNNKHDLDAIIKIQHKVRQYLGRQYAIRLAQDIIYNITGNGYTDFTEVETHSQESQEESLEGQTFNIYSENEGTLYEDYSNLGEAYSTPRGSSTPEGSFKGTSTKSAKTVPTDTTMTDITEASNVWDHSDENSEK